MKWPIGISFLVLAYSACAANFDHAIYISVVEISHDTNNEVATLKVKVFADDLEDAIENEFLERISLNQPVLDNKKANLVSRYVNAHLVFYVGSIKLDWELQDSEKVGDAIWFSFRATCPAEWEQVQVFGDFLTELFPTQTNVFSVDHAGNKKLFKLSKDHKEETIKF